MQTYVKALVVAFYQEKALVGAFSVIVTTNGSFAALQTVDLCPVPHPPQSLGVGVVMPALPHLCNWLARHAASDDATSSAGRHPPDP